MNRDEAIAHVRQRLSSLAFETPTVGALALSRLSYALPSSEAIKGVDAAGIAKDIIRKTIRHSHQANGGLAQDGRGSWAWFSRHVTENDRRWDFEVEVEIDVAGTAVITSVRVVRPGDDEPDPDDPDSPPEVEPRAPLTDADLLPHGMLACPCCGHATLSERGMYQICPICFWEDDGQDSADADEARNGPNRVSLTAGRASYLAIGASVEKDLPHVRKPTREEVQLRRFDAAGREVT